MICRIKYGIELGNGLPPMVTKKEVVEALKKVGTKFYHHFSKSHFFTGFEIVELTDFGTPTEQNPIPWYDTLNGKLTWTGFRYTRIGRWLTAKFVSTLETVKFAPKGNFFTIIYILFNSNVGSLETALMLNRTADNLVEGGSLNIFTPSYFVLCRKPLDAVNPPKATDVKKDR
jgi:sterol 24-C-methyltransferase